MTRFRRAAAGVLAVALLVPAAVGASDDTCAGQIDALSAQTAQATFLGKSAARDEAGLIAKLAEASDKLASGKPDDAVLKLSHFVEKVDTLAATGKLDATDAGALSAAASATIACIVPVEA